VISDIYKSKHSRSVTVPRALKCFIIVEKHVLSVLFKFPVVIFF